MNILAGDRKVSQPASRSLGSPIRRPQECQQAQMYFANDQIIALDSRYLHTFCPTSAMIQKRRSLSADPWSRETIPKSHYLLDDHQAPFKRRADYREVTTPNGLSSTSPATPQGKVHPPYSHHELVEKALHQRNSHVAVVLAAPIQKVAQEPAGRGLVVGVDCLEETLEGEGLAGADCGPIEVAKACLWSVSGMLVVCWMG